MAIVLTLVTNMNKCTQTKQYKNSAQQIQNTVNISKNITKTPTQLSKHPRITKPTHTHTHIYKPHTYPHITNPTHTHPHITKPTHNTPTHYKSHTPTHTHALEKPHPYTHPHITESTHTHIHALQNKLKQPQYKIHTKQNSHNTNTYPQHKVTLMCMVLLYPRTSP